MNALLLGVGDKTKQILERLQPPCLLIDDGPIIDAIKPRKSFVYFDVHEHSVDVLNGMNYRRARDFLSLLNVAFPEGENTLTRKNANFLILEALLDQPKDLKTLVAPTKDPASVEACQKIQTLLLSPILKNVLTKQANIELNTTVLVRLDKKRVPQFDALVVAHLLIMLYRHQVVITDFGHYGRDYLTSLIREERLICGVRSLSQLSDELRDEVLLMDDKEGYRCTVEDAEALAGFTGWAPHSNGYNDFIEKLIAG
jgi:hypothetical protein